MNKNLKIPHCKKLSKLRKHIFNPSQIILLNSLKDSVNWNKSIATPKKESKWWKASLYSTTKSSNFLNSTNTQRLSKLLMKFRFFKSSLEIKKFISYRCFTVPLIMNFQYQHFIKSAKGFQALWLYVRLNLAKKLVGTTLWFGGVM